MHTINSLNKFAYMCLMVLGIEQGTAVIVVGVTASLFLRRRYGVQRDEPRLPDPVQIT